VQIHANESAHAGFFSPPFTYIKLFSNNQTAGFVAIFVRSRIVIEYSWRQEISVPAIRDPGIRAHDVGLR
jgi:hypothetical protein